MAGTLYGFDEPSFKRVQEATRRVLGTPRSGARQRRQVPVLSGRPATESAAACNSCGSVSVESLVIDLGGGLLATDQYLFSAYCGGGQPWVFTWDSGTTWLGVTPETEIDCDGDPVTVTATMVFSSSAPDGVTITLSSGGALAVYKNLTAWQPCSSVRMVLDDYDESCVCIPWDQTPCLVPVEVTP